MATNLDWSRAFAQQAHADYLTYDHLTNTDRPICHSLQFLQMACEKLVKAHRYTNPHDTSEDLQTSHAVIAKGLLQVFRNQESVKKLGENAAKSLLKEMQPLCQAIQLLSPLGQRPNCEYPWESSSKVYSPLEWRFSEVANLNEVPKGHKLLKLVRSSIERLRPGVSDTH